MAPCMLRAARSFFCSKEIPYIATRNPVVSIVSFCGCTGKPEERTFIPYYHIF